MISETILNKIQELSTLVVKDGEKVIPNAMQISHNKDVLRGIFWYRLVDGQMVYSSSATSHFDEQFEDIIAGNMKGWIRGRVGYADGIYFAFVYVCDLPNESISGRIVADVYRKVLSNSRLDIQYITDEEGYNLIENVKETHGLLLPTAGKMCHQTPYKLGIIWYDVKNDKAIYDEKLIHADADKQKGLDSDLSMWVRGRLMKYGGKVFAVVYCYDYFERDLKLNHNAAEKFKNAAQIASKISIDYVINEEGYDLLVECL